MKRSELTRKTPLQRTAFKRTEAKPSKAPKPKRCKNRACRAEYIPDPRQPWKDWCSDDCAVLIALERVEKQRAAKAKTERAEVRRKLAAFKTIPKLKAEVQRVFNEWVRERDLAAGHGCICCGKFATAAALAQPGGAYDACHYRSRGSADHLRFDERNVHLGLKDCNTWGHKNYRGGLIERIGVEAVEALESDQTVVKWTRPMLEELKAKYQQKLRELRSGQR